MKPTALETAEAAYTLATKDTHHKATVLREAQEAYQKAQEEWGAAWDKSMAALEALDALKAEVAQ